MLDSKLVSLIMALFHRQPEDGSRPKISVRTVLNRLVAEIEPVLIANGFERFKRNRALRHREKYVDVLEIQFIRTYTTSRHSPAIQVGRFFTFVPEGVTKSPVKQEDGRFNPDPELCHFRKTIFKSRKQKETKIPNIWYVGPHGEYLDECVKDVRSATISQIIPWFNWLDDWNEVMRLLLHGKEDIEGKERDPVKRGTFGFTHFFSRHVVAGLVACELSQWKLAVERLAPVIDSGGVVGRNRQVFPLPAESMRVIQEAYARALREAGLHHT